MELICNAKDFTVCKRYNDILEYYNINKNEILNKLLNNPQEMKKIFEEDNNCLFNLGAIHKLSVADKVNSSHLLSDRRFKCKHCEMLIRIANNNDIPIGKTFINAHMRKELIVNEYSSNNNIKFTNDLITIKYISSFDDDKPPVCNNYCTSKSSTFLRFDSIINGILISWILEKILGGVVVNIYTAFVCTEKIYTLKDHIHAVPLRNIPRDNIYYIIVQIFKLLYLLKDYDFSISDPEDVFSVDTNYTVKFDKLDSCGITWYSKSDFECKKNTGIRIFAGSQDSDIPTVERSVYIDANLNERVLYRISNHDNLFMLINSSSPFYRSSLNVYIIFEYLMRLDNFKYVILNNKRVYDSYKGLYLPLEFKNLKSDGNHKDVWLRCDALEYINSKLT